MTNEKRQRHDIRISPEPFMIPLKQMWPGYFDPCPYPHTVDGLAIDWPAPFYVNPPGSKNRQFAEKFCNIRGQGAFAAFNWDHSTDFTQRLLYESDVLLLFNYRWHCEGPDAETGVWCVHEVARSSAVFFKGVSAPGIMAIFGEQGKVIAL